MLIIWRQPSFEVWSMFPIRLVILGSTISIRSKPIISKPIWPSTILYPHWEKLGLYWIWLSPNFSRLILQQCMLISQSDHRDSYSSCTLSKWSSGLLHITNRTYQRREESDVSLWSIWLGSWRFFFWSLAAIKLIYNK